MAKLADPHRSGCCEVIRLLVIGLCIAIASDSAARVEPASGHNAYCAGLSRAVASQAHGSEPVFIQSYEPGQNEEHLPRGLATTAFVYDNALAAIALVACGNLTAARPIGDALNRAVRADRTFHDGRIRNAYRAGRSARARLRFRAGGTATRNYGRKILRRMAPRLATSPGLRWHC
jgi:hypothetical protein